MPDKLPDNDPWPRISITTPSYNQGRFLEETMRSVLLQGYPDLEYIVLDGGSDDGSADILRKYSPWLTYWVREPDRGQAHAINKGFSRSTGALLAWINSDDLYLPGALGTFAECYLTNPRAIIMGDVENIVEGDGQCWLTKQFNISFLNIVSPENEPWSWHQPGLFVPRPLVINVGPLDEDLRYAFDLDWLLRLLQYAEVVYLHMKVARFRVHNAAKTTAEYPDGVKETQQLLQQRYWVLIPNFNVKYGKALHSLSRAAIHLGHHSKYKMYWNRVTGAQQLIAAFMLSPRILAHPNYWKLCRRAALPKCLFRSSPWRPTSQLE